MKIWGGWYLGWLRGGFGYGGRKFTTKELYAWDVYIRREVLI